MKRSTSLIIILSLVLAFMLGCEDKTKTANEEPNKQPEEISEKYPLNPNVQYYHEGDFADIIPGESTLDDIKNIGFPQTGMIVLSDRYSLAFPLYTGKTMIIGVGFDHVVIYKIVK